MKHILVYIFKKIWNSFCSSNLGWYLFIAIAVINVSFVLQYNPTWCEAISGRNYKIARNFLAYMLGYIVMKKRKVNREKGYCNEQILQYALIDWNTFSYKEV